MITREGSIRGAANLLSLSPSALNRAVQGFEDEIGLEIFERISGGVRLSTAGELLLGTIDRHLTEFDDLQVQLGKMRDGLSGTLRLSFGSDINAGLLSACVATFERDYPGVSVEIVTDDTIESLQGRRVDLAILTNPVTDGAVEVLYSHAVPLLAWRHKSDAPPLGGLWDIAGHRLILPPEGTGTRIAVSHLLRKNRMEEGVTTTLSAAQISAVGEGKQAQSIQVFPVTSLGPGLATTVDQLGIAMGQVQLSVLRLARGVLTRPAQAYLLLLQKHMDAVGGESHETVGLHTDFAKPALDEGLPESRQE